MGGHPAGITVDAVREQLAALGHDDVSDDVIASFLDSLMAHQVNVDSSLPVENVAAANGADDAPPPPVERTDALTRGHSPEATAARTPGGTERAPCLTSPEPDGTREGSRRSRTTPNDDAVPNRRATPPTGARPAPTSSGRRAATRSVALAIPTVITPAVTPGDASRTPPDRLLTPNSSATRHRRDQSKSPKDLVHEDIIGWCAKRSVASVTPGRVTGGKTTPRRTGHNSSVIASPMPIRAGVGTPGQRVRIDRVARAAQYAAVWSEDAYLERRRAGNGGGGGKSAVTSAGNGRDTLGAHSCVDFLDADEATVFGTRSKLAYDRYPDRYPAAYDVNGVRGGSWGRAQRKLTDGTNEWRVDVERGEREKENTRRVSTSGFWEDSKRGLKAKGAKGATGKGFKTPDERRRDALRWEVRARMAAPPTF